MFVSKIFPLVILSTWCDCSPNRVKRIVNGWSIEGREGPFSVVRYAVGIGTLHRRPWWLLGIYFESLAKFGVYGRVTCGGALLTPYVVQTACHCMAIFIRNPNRRIELVRVDHNFESRAVIYVGVNDQWGDHSMMDVTPLVSQQFIPHESCATIIPEAIPLHEKTDDDDSVANRFKFVPTHDFGLIRVKDPDWIGGWKGVPTTNVQFAPIYSQEEIERIKVEFGKSLPVCLTVGWGVTDYDGHETNSIRGGWSQMMRPQDCVANTAKNGSGAANLNDDEIKKYMTWECAERVPAIFQKAGAGDSGSPITCNNAYIGVLSSEWIILQKHQTVTYYNPEYKYVTIMSAISHTLFENASNFRRAFDETLKTWFGITFDDIIRKLTAHWGHNFVQHVAEEVLEEAVNHIIEEAILAAASARSGNQSLKNSHSRSRSLMKYTSITRLMNQERAVQSFSGTLYASPILLVFSSITLPFS